jgi:hypothetical protein
MSFKSLAWKELFLADEANIFFALLLMLEVPCLWFIMNQQLVSLKVKVCAELFAAFVALNMSFSIFLFLLFRSFFLFVLFNILNFFFGIRHYFKCCLQIFNEYITWFLFSYGRGLILIKECRVGSVLFLWLL